jgi:hypothetical protein
MFASLIFLSSMLVTVQAASPTAASPAATNAMAGVSPKVQRYVKHLLAQYDVNADGRLQEAEWRKMHGEPAAIDANHDGIITSDELAVWIINFGYARRIHLALPATATPATRGGVTPPGAGATSASVLGNDVNGGGVGRSGAKSRRETKFYVPRSRLPDGLPDWFLARDLDGDAQLTFSEFSASGSPSDLEEFRRFDRNGDGVVTAAECVRVLQGNKPSKTAASKKGTSAASTKAE